VVATESHRVAPPGTASNSILTSRHRNAPAKQCNPGMKKRQLRLTTATAATATTVTTATEAAAAPAAAASATTVEAHCDCWCAGKRDINVYSVVLGGPGERWCADRLLRHNGSGCAALSRLSRSSNLGAKFHGLQKKKSGPRLAQAWSAGEVLDALIGWIWVLQGCSPP